MTNNIITPHQRLKDLTDYVAHTKFFAPRWDERGPMNR
jgi:hypothetical protein